MSKQIPWNSIDVAIRKCHDFILESHRYIRRGSQESGLHDGMNTRISAIELKKYLEKIIETGKNNA